MKVCHVSTFDGGGAFIAGLRYHEQLLKMNVESSFLVAPKSIHKKISKLYYDHYAPSFTAKIANRVNIIARNSKKLKALKGDYELFSFPQTVYQVEENEHIQQADIIHLHFVSQYINYPGFFKAVKKPMVWTLHDMNPIMGGFHYNIDLERNKEVFQWMEAKMALKKKELAANSNIHFIALSNWMYESLKQSYYAEYSASIVHNGIDLLVYKTINNIEDVTSHSVKKKILFVAESFKSYRKGFDLLVDALNDEEVLCKAELLALGNMHGAEIPGNMEINALGFINDEQQKVAIYNSADVVIIPSREDNFPNIMLEAMACGKPVIAFANGGMSDVIDNTTNGLLVREVSATALRKTILKFLNNEIVFDAATIRKFAEARFCIEKQTGKLINIYKSLL